jgi:hypothetical protein
LTNIGASIGYSPNEPYLGQSVRVIDDPGAESRHGSTARPERDDIAAMLTEVRSLLLRVMANNHHPDRAVTLPAGVVDAAVRAQDEVAEACQQMLDNWDSMTSTQKEQPETP